MNNCPYFSDNDHCNVYAWTCTFNEWDCNQNPECEIRQLVKENEQLKNTIREIRDAWQGGVCNNGVNNNYRPIKNTKKEDCYNALGKIQTILSNWRNL